MKIRFFHSIPWKLTLCFIGIILLTLLMVFIGIGSAARRAADTELKKELQERSRAAALLLSRRVEEGEDLDNASLPAVGMESLFRVTVQIIDTEGRVLSTSREGKIRDVSISSQDLARLRRGEDIYNVILSSSPDKRGAYSISPIRRGGEIVGGVLTIFPLGQEVPVRRRFSRAILSSLILVALIASVIAFFIAQAVTQPLRALEEASRSISEGDFSQSLKIRRKDEIGALAEAFSDMSCKLERNIESRLQMTADISHELRTPLTTIRGCAEAIVDGVVSSDSDRNAYLANIIRQTRKLSELIDDLMELSRFEAGEVVINRENFDARRLIEGVVETAGVVAKKKGIEIEACLPASLVRVDADPERIERALLNLVNNAVQHNPESTRIRIILEVSGGEAHFSVVDTGGGIPSGELERIFERFHKADRSRTSVGGGSGLGLAIVREILRAHGSEITVTSSDSGTRFGFSLSVV